ncbi:glutathione S-transferase N-terminal domain-containing protein [Novosphingobium sp. PS1R-30]|uniref:Glutathione S-transferase N-terminal domain-containing protein n=1 Tax=Novosphingobium anseongense TaxID=3133436 RepID=A0ABU8RUH5_9SPHN
MSEKLVLHGMQSPNVVKVILMLEECGLDYELRHTAVFAQAQFEPEFLALNPLGKVPVLEDPKLGQNGKMGALFESGAILLWLAEREGKFLPTAQPQRAEVMQWLMVQMANYGPMLGQVNHFNIAPPETAPYAKARYAAVAAKLNRLLDERLQSREWIAGDAYSIADMATQPWAWYVERHGFDPADYPALIAWREKIAARPASQRAMARVAEAFDEVANATRKQASRADLDRFFGRTETVPETDFTAVQQM